MKKCKAFTLAEVLITLVIIGVIAAMTIPALLNNTNKQEYRTGAKKALSVLNQAVSQHYALTGETLDDIINNCDYDSDCVYDEFWSKRFNVASTASSSDAYHYGDVIVYTTDGIAYSYESDFYSISVDVNGEKGPNMVTTNPNDVKDGFRYGRVYNDDLGGWQNSIIPCEESGTAGVILDSIDDDTYYGEGCIAS
ncbi:MAG: type II secretion system protein [Candidatus Gastranaerophilales bacterium]|nr:type II secretion system protein [Candidatus Gastranaerophilales bacterium]